MAELTEELNNITIILDTIRGLTGRTAESTQEIDKRLTSLRHRKNVTTSKSSSSIIYSKKLPSIDSLVTANLNLRINYAINC
jgi:methyl-accepting chemotaxis protein